MVIYCFCVKWFRRRRRCRHFVVVFRLKNPKWNGIPCGPVDEQQLKKQRGKNTICFWAGGRWISEIILSSPSCWFRKCRCTVHTHLSTTWNEFGTYTIRFILNGEKNRNAVQQKTDEQFYTENVSISWISWTIIIFSSELDFGCRSTIFASLPFSASLASDSVFSSGSTHQLKLTIIIHIITHGTEYECV